MEKGFIIRWLLKKNVNGFLEIEKKEVSAYAPINRVLDRVGFFSFRPIQIDDKRFLIVFEPEEENETKSKLLVSRISSTVNKIIDITDDDYEQVLKIAEMYMKVTILTQ
ncbi:MAG TPA: hypothetical protein PLR26_05180 [Bacilli bacterium]|nr:hypothetical protein [Bacilli bacterium]